ncbi:MAG: hypothetical protein ABF379_13945 [Akkermansiaceae bacterium]
MSPLVEGLHGNEFDQLKALARGEEGALISLRAPRAGYGKTMLLSRLREEMKGAAVIIPVELSADFRIEEKDILGRILDRLTAVIPGKRDLTELDFSVRRILASALIPLVESGEVPSPNRTESLRSLRERPEEVFDFQKESAAVAQWVKVQFSALSPRLVSVIGQRCGGASGELSQWFSALSRYAMTPTEKRGRNHDLLNEVFGADSQLQTGMFSHGVLTSFLKLISTTENVVLVVDEVDGLFGDSEAALRVANTLVALRQAAPRIKVIFSVNDDVWESTFARRIPLGMQDRFEDSVIRLKHLDEERVMELLKTRHADGADELRRKIQLDGGCLYPRAVLRAARDAWGSQSIVEEPASASFVTADASLPPIKDIGFAEVRAKRIVETDLAESGKPDIPFACPVVKNQYPPKPVRRAEIPRKFLVQRIRQGDDLIKVPPVSSPPVSSPPVSSPPVSSPSVSSPPVSSPPASNLPASAPFESPFQIVESSQAESSNQAKTIPPTFPGGEGESPPNPSLIDSDSIDDLLRKFRERKDSKDLY